MHYFVFSGVQLEHQKSRSDASESDWLFTSELLGSSIQGKIKMQLNAAVTELRAYF